MFVAYLGVSLFFAFRFFGHRSLIARDSDGDRFVEVYEFLQRLIDCDLEFVCGEVA